MSTYIKKKHQKNTLLGQTWSLYQQKNIINMKCYIHPEQYWNNIGIYIWANLQVCLSIQTGGCDMAWTIKSIWGQKHQICRENFIFGYTDNITHLWEIRRKGITHFKRQGFVSILFQRDGLFNFLCIFWNVEELRGLSMWSKYSATDTHTENFIL